MPQHAKATVHQSLRGERGTFSRQLCDDILDAWVVEITYAVSDKVNALYWGATIDPLLARMPAFDRRRVQDLLPHMFHLVEYGFKARLGLGPIADQAHRADHRLDRALDPGKAGVLEGVGVEQHPKHGTDAISGPEEFIFRHLVGLGVV